MFVIYLHILIKKFQTLKYTPRNASLKQYKLQPLHKLECGETAMSESFAECAIKIIESELQWLFNVFRTNKAHFTPHEDVSKTLLYERCHD